MARNFNNPNKNAFFSNDTGGGATNRPQNA